VEACRSHWKLFTAVRRRTRVSALTNTDVCRVGPGDARKALPAVNSVEFSTSSLLFSVFSSTLLV
jgi:hypothetical protein